jgi:hypothetical protein
MQTGLWFDLVKHAEQCAMGRARPCKDSFLDCFFDNFDSSKKFRF